jgi:hypothetical protein
LKNKSMPQILQISQKFAGKSRMPHAYVAAFGWG